MMTGPQLRAILDPAHPLEDTPVDKRVASLGQEDLACVLSHLLTDYQFDSWQYAVLSEACERLSPQEE